MTVRECVLEEALGLLDVLPDLPEAIRPRSVPAVSGETRLEWAPYGVVLGWHAANSPVWVPTLVAASALAGGNAVLARPSSRTRVTHTYDWTELHDEARLERARSTTSDRLAASVDRLASLAESDRR